MRLAEGVHPKKDMLVGVQRAPQTIRAGGSACEVGCEACAAVQAVLKGLPILYGQDMWTSLSWMMTLAV